MTKDERLARDLIFARNTIKDIHKVMENSYYQGYLAGQNAKSKRTSEEINKAAKWYVLDIRSQSQVERG